MFKKTEKYGLNKKELESKMRRAALGVAMTGVSLCALNSCGPDEPDDPSTPTNPYATQIEAKKNDSIAQANAVRAAVAPAKTDPNDISSFFDGRFHGQETAVLGGTATTLPDSAKVFVKTVENINNFGVTTDALTALKTKSNTYVATVAELADLRAKSKALGY